jgi:ferric-dicitrate binding protein FerR (iron transport regulator)
MKSDSERLDQLLARLVDETLDADELAEIESLLDGNPDAQDHYFHYLGLHADLTQAGADEKVSGRPAGPVPVRPWHSAALIGLAASIVAILSATFLLWPEPPPILAKLSEVDGPVRWTNDSGEVLNNLEIDRSLGSGTLESLAADSSAEFTFLDGTRVTLSGHSTITITEQGNRKVLRLREGRFSIDAAEQPADSPMLVLTPSAEAEVLGTQFNVAASSFATRVTVNEGLVRVKRLADGSVQEVAADHQVVAALEQGTDFQALPRKKHATTWTSEFPRDIFQGDWQPGGPGRAGTLLARPHLFKGDSGSRGVNEVLEKPVLLYSAVLNPSAKDRPPVRLTDSARFLIRGRLKRSHQVSFGFGTNRLRGGFSGKFTTSRRIEIDGSPDGSFEIEFSIHDFPRSRETYPESPVGHELVWMWIQTVRKDAGLQIERVELLP